jgi:hypothetical protein
VAPGLAPRCSRRSERAALPHSAPPNFALLRDSHSSCFSFDNAVNNLRNGQWKPHEETVKFLPMKIAFIVPAVQPSLPSTHYFPSKLLERLDVSRNTIVGEMTSHLFTKFLPLLTNRTMPIPSTPLLNLLEAASDSRLHRLAFDRPVALWGFIPIVRKSEQVKRLWLPIFFRPRPVRSGRGSPFSLSSKARRRVS